METMELTFDKSTHIGLGFANHTDAFQCGREAAQMAKNQLPLDETDLVLVFCPTGIHFKDFIEGVRLVTGEEKLIGIPVDWALTNDLPSIGSCVVVIFQLPSVYCTIACTPERSSNIDVSITSLLSQFRQFRGSARHVFEHRGLLILENKERENMAGMARTLIADLDFETWAAGITPIGRNDNPLIWRNQAVRCGLVGIEFFSNKPIGVGSVGLDSFSGQIDVYREAAKSAVRDALAQMEEKTAAFGLLFVHPPEKNWSHDELWSVYRAATGSLSHVPFIMVPTRQQFSRSTQRSTGLQLPSVLSLVVPK
jgi:hypothetical protein